MSVGSDIHVPRWLWTDHASVCRFSLLFDPVTGGEEQDLEVLLWGANGDGFLSML